MFSPMDEVTLSVLFATLSIQYYLAAFAESTPLISSRITVVGAVFCDTCHDQGFSRYSYFMPGSDVHIKCKFNANSPRTTEMITFSVNRTTNKYGVYMVEIPSVDGVDCIDGPPIQSFCQATLIGSSSATCNVPALKATTNEISVKSKQGNLCVYGFIPLSFKPSKMNNTLCEKQRKQSKDSANSRKINLPHDFSWPHLPTSSILQAFGPIPLTNPPSMPYPFSRLPPSLSPLPSFNLGDPTTWKPRTPLMSPPLPTFDQHDPKTRKPLFPPTNLENHNP